MVKTLTFNFGTLPNVERSLDLAQKLYDQNPSYQNLCRLESAQDRYEREYGNQLGELSAS